MPDLEAILQRLNQAFPLAKIERLSNPGCSGQDSLLIHPESALEIVRFLRDDPELRFDYLSNVTGVDWLQAETARAVAKPEGDAADAGGFLEVIYHLYSIPLRRGPLVLRMRTTGRQGTPGLPSLVSLYRSAEFQEREVYDLFGVNFEGHPDLRRLLMWDEFVGHPMRKDYVAPDDYEYEPTPHGSVLERLRSAGGPEGSPQ